MSQNYINHVVLNLDASASMGPHRNNLIRVADGQIKYLAQRSQELDQETRVSVYSFNEEVECLIYDKDVCVCRRFRASINGRYDSPGGFER
jgi:hypothetical protein